MAFKTLHKKYFNRLNTWKKKKASEAAGRKEVGVYLPVFMSSNLMSWTSLAVKQNIHLV